MGKLTLVLVLCVCAIAGTHVSALAYQPGGPASAKAAAAAQVPAEGVILAGPGFTVTRSRGIESVELQGTQYSDFRQDGKSVSFIVPDASLGQGSQPVPRNSAVRQGLTTVAYEPADNGTKVTLSFARVPQQAVINAMPGSELHPDKPQVIAAFSYSNDADDSKSSPAYGVPDSPSNQGRRSATGDYDLPKFPPYHYSDALVTLRADNVDFRQVLWLFSRIGNVDIMLDPYWATEPTGSTRPPGGGAVVGGGGNAGGGGGGFRSGGDFGPVGLTSGTGNLSFNFIDVPFDTALDLVIKSVGLVYVDIDTSESANAA